MSKVNIQGALSNYDLLKWGKLLNISLRGIYMLDGLPQRIQTNERVIVNLDKEGGVGTHWVAYIKKGKKVYYFDPVGDFQPPYELTKYWKKESNVEIFYNINPVQPIDSDICGHLSILFLADQL